MSISLRPTYTCQKCGETIFVTGAQAHMSWHGAYKQAAPPTTATERKLAPGWERCSGFICDAMPDGSHGSGYTLGNHRKWCGRKAAYVADRLSNERLTACEDHAEAGGVFAVEPPQPVPDAAMRDLLWGNRASGSEASKPATPQRRAACATCTHVHAGPCNGTSPNGEFACPCGHPKAVAKRERVNVVGTYGGSDTWIDQVARRAVDYMDDAKNHAANLLDNLAREKPPGRRPIRTVARYEGNSDD